VMSAAALNSGSLPSFRSACASARATSCALRRPRRRSRWTRTCQRLQGLRLGAPVGSLPKGWSPGARQAPGWNLKLPSPLPKVCRERNT
jgi:hypothetical protein